VPCKSDTLFVTVTFDPSTINANLLHVTVTFNGHSLSADAHRSPGPARDTVEVRFEPGMYPQGQTVTVGVTASFDNNLLGSGVSQPLALTGGCARLDVDVGFAGDAGAPLDLFGVDAPPPKMQGDPCAAGAECKSTNCVDGYCCDAPCVGACEACDVDQHHGQCTPVTSGQPHDKPACANAGQTCGGACSSDSRTSCKFPVGTTPCRTQTCTAGTKTFGASCDGAGNCPAAITTACACNGAGTDCIGACQDDTTCVAPNSFCNSGTCLATKPTGRMCTGPGECTSGNCVDGYCCDTSCGARCQACDVGGNEGTCTTLIAGQPHNKPACSGSGACGGSCQGATSCGYPVAGTPCTTQTCSGSTEDLAATCDGAGACGTPQQMSCDPYACNTAGTGCNTTCTVNADCDTTTGAVCDPTTSTCCVPQCAGKSCGPDGCGGSCAPGCAAGEVCKSDGTCCATGCGTSCGGADACGGTCTCGIGLRCFMGSCCRPSCAGSGGCGPTICGSDGCGGSCGNCPGGLPTCCRTVCKPAGGFCSLPCG